MHSTGLLKELLKALVKSFYLYQRLLLEICSLRMKSNRECLFILIGIFYYFQRILAKSLKTEVVRFIIK